MSLLFSPLKIKETVFKNRITISPMCMYSSIDGFANNFHLVHLGSRAVGGAALIIQEATAVSPEGRITNGDMGLWNDEQIEKVKAIVEFVHSQNSLIGIQLAHAGRKASYQLPKDGAKKIAADAENGWETVSASGIPFREDEPVPVSLDNAGIKKVKDDFVNAAIRSEKAGYDVLEIHAAHGYLFHQFYSPLANERKDKYGGSFENRIRFLVEVTTEVRKVWPENKPLFVRISATDWTEGGWDIEDSVKLSIKLKELGVDIIDTSTGGNVPKATIPSEPGYQVDFSNEIKHKANILTGAVGQITTAEQSEKILSENKADLIFYGRESLRQPYFPLHAANDLNENIEWPEQYKRAKI